MTESDNYTGGGRAGPKTNPDDYLPDYSPRPRYVIATIYPPSNNPPEREIAGRNVFIKPPDLSQQMGSESPDMALAARPKEGIVETERRDQLWDILYPPAERNCSDPSVRFLKPPATISNLYPHLNHLPGDTEPPARELFHSMDLPRGKFRSLERNASIISILRHLHNHEFRGTCRINRGGSNIRLVFDHGRIILAEYDNLVGDKALGMVYAHRFSQCDTLVSDFDEAQIRLSLEFNQSWCVKGNQEPDWIASGRIIRNAGNSQSGGSFFVPDQYPEKIPGPEMQPVYQDPGSLGTSQTNVDSVTTNDVITPGPPGEEGVHTAPYVENEQADWKRALTIPLSSSYDNAAPSHDPECSVKDIRSCIDPMHSEDQVEGWKKALYLPVEPVNTSEWRFDGADVTGGSIPVYLHEFELLPADSILFEAVRLRERMPKFFGPEPSEQWKYMGANRGENSSV